MKHLALAALAAANLSALTCDLSEYKAQPGLTAASSSDALTLTWQGKAGQEGRATFAIIGGVPTIRELAVRKAGGAWVPLGTNLTPDYQVTSGVRRISEQQMSPLKKLGLTSPDVIEREKWKVFWDAPLAVPGNPSTNPGLPRKPEEVRRATATITPPDAR